MSLYFSDVLFSSYYASSLLIFHIASRQRKLILQLTRLVWFPLSDNEIIRFDWFPLLPYWRKYKL